MKDLTNENHKSLDYESDVSMEEEVDGLLQKRKEENTKISGKLSTTTLSEAYGTWTLFRGSPKELWIILILKMIESFALITEELVLMIFLKEEIGL